MDDINSKFDTFFKSYSFDMKLLLDRLSIRPPETDPALFYDRSIAGYEFTTNNTAAALSHSAAAYEALLNEEKRARHEYDGESLDFLTQSNNNNNNSQNHQLVAFSNRSFVRKPAAATTTTNATNNTLNATSAAGSLKRLSRNISINSINEEKQCDLANDEASDNNNAKSQQQKQQQLIDDEKILFEKSTSQQQIDDEEAKDDENKSIDSNLMLMQSIQTTINEANRERKSKIVTRRSETDMIRHERDHHQQEQHANKSDADLSISATIARPDDFHLSNDSIAVAMRTPEVKLKSEARRSILEEEVTTTASDEIKEGDDAESIEMKMLLTDSNDENKKS